MDPMTLGGVVAGAAVVLGFVFWFFTRGGDNFEKWYSAQRQLDEEEERKKKRSNHGKKKDKSEKKAEAKEKEQKSEKRNSVEDDEKADGAIEVKNKKKNKKGSVSDESFQKKEGTPELQKSIEKIQVDKKSAPNPSSEKKEKLTSLRERSPVKKSEGDFTEVTHKKKRSPEEKEKKEVTNSVESPKKTHRTLEEMDIGKLMSDIVASTTDQVHLKFLRSYLDTQKKKEAALSEASLASAAEKNELIKENEEKSAKIKALEEVIAHHQSEKTGLIDHANQLMQKERFLQGECQKLSHEIQFLRTNENAGKQAVHIARQQLNELNRKLESTTAEIVQQMKKTKELEAALAQAQKLTAATDAIHEKWQKLRPVLSEKQAPVQPVAHTATSGDEKAALLKQHAKEKKDWEEKHSLLMEEYLAIQKLCDQLKVEVANFEKWKAELEKSSQEVDSQKQEITQIKKAHATLQAENAALKKQVEELNKKINGAAENGDLGEEVVILAKSANLTSAPPGLESVENKLREENQRLKEKNEELRNRNFKLAEMIESSTATTSTKPAVEQKTDSPATKDSKSKKKNEETIAIAPTPTTGSTTAAAESIQIKSYRDALLAVKSELSNISQLADQRQERINQLEAQIQHKQLQTPKLAAAPAPKATPAFSTSIRSAKPSSVAGIDKSGEENDWELV